MNLLGIRETEIYGNISLSQIEKKLQRLSEDLGIDVIFFSQIIKVKRRHHDHPKPDPPNRR
jgi:3-dehydroquinate dehydratase